MDVTGLLCCDWTTVLYTDSVWVWLDHCVVTGPLCCDWTPVGVTGPLCCDWTTVLYTDSVEVWLDHYVVHTLSVWGWEEGGGVMGPLWCVCVRARARARARVCVCVCVYNNVCDRGWLSTTKISVVWSTRSLGLLILLKPLSIAHRSNFPPHANNYSLWQTDSWTTQIVHRCLLIWSATK